MHGTYVLDCRLGNNVPHRIRDGDKVTFGIQVTRAQGTSTSYFSLIKPAFSAARIKTAERLLSDLPYDLIAY